MEEGQNQIQKSRQTWDRKGRGMEKRQHPQGILASLKQSYH